PCRHDRRLGEDAVARGAATKSAFVLSGNSQRLAQKKRGEPFPARPSSFSQTTGRLSSRAHRAGPEEAEAVVVAAEPRKYPSPGSPIRPGTSASPEAAVEAAAAEVVVAAAEPSPERQSSA